MKTETTPEEMRIEVLKWMGFEYDEDSPYESLKWRIGAVYQQIPALTLDWLHECEKKLSLDQRTTYLDYLRCITQENRMATNLWTCVNATAPQRLEALYRTIKNL